MFTLRDKPGATIAAKNCVQQIRAEYHDLPGLSLSAAQAQRLCHVDAETCHSVLKQMVRNEFLRRTPEAQYVRADLGLRSRALPGDYDDITVQSR